MPNAVAALGKISAPRWLIPTAGQHVHPEPLGDDELRDHRDLERHHERGHRSSRTARSGRGSGTARSVPASEAQHQVSQHGHHRVTMALLTKNQPNGALCQRVRVSWPARIWCGTSTGGKCSASARVSTEVTTSHTNGKISTIVAGISTRCHGLERQPPPPPAAPGPRRRLGDRTPTAGGRRCRGHDR